VDDASGGCPRPTTPKADNPSGAEKPYSSPQLQRLPARDGLRHGTATVASTTSGPPLPPATNGGGHSGRTYLQIPQYALPATEYFPPPCRDRPGLADPPPRGSPTAGPRGVFFHSLPDRPPVKLVGRFPSRAGKRHRISRLKKTEAGEWLSVKLKRRIHRRLGNLRFQARPRSRPGPFRFPASKA